MFIALVKCWRQKYSAVDRKNGLLYNISRKEANITMEKNIVLIGMSGCGKTTIGKMLLKELSMDFFDTDEMIEKEDGRKIKDIFKEDGEVYFRKLETESAKKASQFQNAIISTGGGMILKEENMKYLKKNSFVVYLKRSVESIKKTMDASNRPLLAEGLKKLYDMEKERGELYEKYADFTVINEGSPEETLKKILNFLKK